LDWTELLQPANSTMSIRTAIKNLRITTPYFAKRNSTAIFISSGLASTKK